jgi:hypothetical protein
MITNDPVKILVPRDDRLEDLRVRVARKHPTRPPNNNEYLSDNGHLVDITFLCDCLAEAGYNWVRIVSYGMKSPIDTFPDLGPYPAGRENIPLMVDIGFEVPTSELILLGFPSGKPHAYKGLY